LLNSIVEQEVEHESEETDYNTFSDSSDESNNIELEEIITPD